MTDRQPGQLPPLLQMEGRQAVWTIARPTVLLGLIRSGYFLGNSFWIAFLGSDALAALGGAAFGLWTCYALMELAATGVYSEVAQAVGAGDSDRARRVLGNGLILAGGVGLGVGLFLYLGRDLYFVLLGAPPDPVREAGVVFLAVSATGILPQCVHTTLTSTFRAVGDAQTPLRITAGTLALNLALDPLLIFGLGPWKGFGIAGAALATTLAAVVGVALSFYGLHQRGYGPSFTALSWRRLLGLARVGLPIAASGTGFSLVYVFLGQEINLFGAPALAAVGLGHRIESIGYMACIGFQVAATTLVGQWIGAGDPERAARAAREVRIEMCRSILPISIVVFVCAELLLYPFSRDPQVVEYAAWYLRLNGAVMVLMGLELLYEGAMAGVGRTLPALVIAFPLTAARIPLSHLLGVTAGLGPAGIWLAIAGTTALKGLLLMAWFNLGRWNTGPRASSEGREW